MNLSRPLSEVIRTTPSHLKKLKEMGIETVEDLLSYYPKKIESTNFTQQGSDIVLNEKNSLLGRITHIRKEVTPRGKKMVKAAFSLHDESLLEVIWFQAPYLLRNMKEETTLFLVGKVQRNYGKLQIMNPEIHLVDNVHTETFRPIYAESPPITSKWLREKIQGLILFAKDIPETLPTEILEEERLFEKTKSLQVIHHPKTLEDWKQARKRIAFEELFIIQTSVLQKKIMAQEHSKNLYRFVFDPELIKKDLETIPFALTFAQKRTLFQILQDFEKPKRMHRLVQGDVGSGKTIVAFLAALQVIRQGWQVAIMAPTEILAKQHFLSALHFFPDTYRVELLTGSVPLAQKKKIKDHLKHGDISVLIGTHALLTEDTVFDRLAFVVIDEQHRFGVAQRALLSESGSHSLSMTATPIPRTLALTVYGDQDLAVIDELPPGRRPPLTKIIAGDAAERQAYLFLEDQIEKGFQVFWICPLIDESDKLELKNVVQEYDRIAQELFPKRRVIFLHGKMKSREKDAIMNAFKNKEYDILVSTSVIEVGVDIPNATAMVIENSERFGLAQLHQFRGRIGRNDKACYCFLMVGKPDDKNKERLKTMEKSHNGLYLAEVDLKLRGMGEIYGSRQSGIPNLQYADITDTDLMMKAREWAEKILQKDLQLKSLPGLKRAIQKQDVYLG